MDTIKLIFYGIISNVLCCFGFFGNTLAIYIINSTKDMRRTSINIYLTVLALYDNGVLIFSVLMLNLPAITDYQLQHQSMDRREFRDNTETISIDFVPTHSNSSDGISTTLSLFSDSRSIIQSTGQIPEINHNRNDLENRNFEMLFNHSDISVDLHHSLDKMLNSSLKELWRFCFEPSKTSSRMIDPQNSSTSKETIQKQLCLISDRLHKNQILNEKFSPSRRKSEISMSTECESVLNETLLIINAFHIHRLIPNENLTKIPSRWLLSLNLQCQPTEEECRLADYPFYTLVSYVKLIYPLALIAQTGSIWTTCLITIEVLNTRIYACLRCADHNRHELTRARQSELHLASMLVAVVAVFIGKIVRIKIKERKNL
ncbi:hypothetical protein SSS_00671 [Sarcoptes scabiei]|uniref:G-protein coupled receptors family 1 profile domain-containing protein n=1 Tax=Sarcoptes scabiei TaxID=52283 RepID=A0A834REJ0_SARSC|nr:hypothetical protein SSS_00671 [Sarcoptes scabiei]